MNIQKLIKLDNYIANFSIILIIYYKLRFSFQFSNFQIPYFTIYYTKIIKIQKKF